MAAAAVPLACGGSATLNHAATDESYEHVRAALSAYDSAGFLAGPASFPVVGRPIVLPGPADSVFVGFAASMPPSALRFAREDGLVAGRYQVTMMIRSGPDTLARADRREIVRVEDFEETGSREPRIVFQAFELVPVTGRLTLEVAVRDLAARRQAEASFDLTAAAGWGLSPPVLAYRAARRSSFAEPPDVLSRPRHTAYASQEPPLVLIEAGAGAAGPLTLSVERDGGTIWSETVELASTDGGPPAAVAALPVRLLPPGAATLRAAPDAGTGVTAPLYVGLSPEWTFSEWGRALAHLAHALDADTLETWQGVPSGEHAEVWARFQQRTDPDPSTPANEFLAEYFERMSLANTRFDEPGRAGWETDRGEVLVKLGEPDRQRFVRPERQGEVPRIEWEYEEAVPSPTLIVFEDATDFGVFTMTPRSRAILRRIAGELAGRRVSAAEETE